MFISKIAKYVSAVKNENLLEKRLIRTLNIYAQNIDCGYMLEPPSRGGSNKYPQSMFGSEIGKKIVYPCICQFYYIKPRF